MDQMELRSGKILLETGMRGDSEEEFDEEVATALEVYAIGGVDKEERVSPTRMERLETDTLYQLPPYPTMDISSVRYRPMLVTTLADLTLERGPTRLDALEGARFNNYSRLVVGLADLHLQRQISLRMACRPLRSLPHTNDQIFSKSNLNVKIQL